MATASLLQTFPISLTSMPPMDRRPEPVRRRPGPVQGYALSTLGHAIEYLIDSRIREGGTTDAENEAIRLMMACSRAVFDECALHKPLRRRVGQKVGQWLSQRLRQSEA